MATKVVAVANQKGGVGKTTTAVNLAAGIAASGRSTLLLDLDPQGNATTGLGLDKSSDRPTIYHVLMGDSPADAIRPTAIPTLWAIASDIDLVGAEIELVTTQSRETRLKQVIDKLGDAYNYLIIDCPPSLGLLTLNALTAAHSVLIPLQCEFYALEGLTNLVKTIKLVRDRLNPRLVVEGILLTMFDGRTSLAAQVREEVRKYFPDEIFTTIVPRNVRLTEAPSHGKPVILYDLKSAGAIAYLEVTREVLAHE